MDRRSKYISYVAAYKDKENAHMRPSSDIKTILSKLNRLTKVIPDWMNKMEIRRSSATKMFMFYEDFETTDRELDCKPGYTKLVVLGSEEREIKGSLEILENTYRDHVRRGVIESDVILDALLG